MRARHASYGARIELKPRPQVPDGLPVSMYLAFWLKVLVQRDKIENRQKKITNMRIHKRLVSKLVSTELFLQYDESVRTLGVPDVDGWKKQF